jgi:hypothetical protein
MKIPTPATLLLPLFFATASLVCAQAGATAPKTYTLFEGDNILVGQGSELHLVRDVEGGSWVVNENGQQVMVSAKNGPISMKVTPVQKLTQVCATISGMKGERAYTPGNDPAEKLVRAMNEGAMLDASSHAAGNQASAKSDETTAQTNTGAKAGGASTTPASTGTAAASATVASPDNVTNGTEVFGQSSDGGDYDALDVAFDIACPQKLGSPYIVVITKFHEPGSEASAERNLIYAQALNPVDTQAIHVKFEQAGFPPGYDLLGFEIHLYDNGVEIATNMSPKRSMLSTDEAFDYVKSKYLAAHKGQTLPAVPAMVGTLPTDLQDQLAAGKYGVTVYVKVSKDGLADEAFSDSACSQKIEDPYLVTVVKAIRFKPALAQGEPVEGTAPVDISRLRT